MDTGNCHRRPASTRPRTLESIGPDVSAAVKFENKYLLFCKLNNYDPQNGSSLAACVGQAIAMGAAMSSMKTNVENLLARKKIGIKDSWIVMCALRMGHAESNDVQPRLYVGTQVRLTHLVTTLEDSVEKRVLVWLMYATGARAADMTWVKPCHLILGPKSLTWQRRITKTARDRGRRCELEYFYEWTMAPPKDVLIFWKKNRAADTLLVHGAKDLTLKRIAGTVIDLLRRTGGEEEKCITSYTFRDYLENLLRSKDDIPEEQVNLLLDHGRGVAEASYRNAPVKLESKKASLKKEMAKRKKAQQAKEKKKSAARTRKKKATK